MEAPAPPVATQAEGTPRLPVTNEHCYGARHTTVQAFLDTDAAVSLISSRVVQTLGLPKILRVEILGGDQVCCYYANFDLQSAHTHILDNLFQFSPCSEGRSVFSLPLLQGREPLADPDLRSHVRVDVQNTLLLG